MDRIITFDPDEINDESVDALIEDLTSLTLTSSENIQLTMSSNGGKLLAAHRLYEFLCKLQDTTLIFGFVDGMCHSAAVLPLLGCTYRTAVPSATFLVHYPHYTLDEEILYANDPNQKQSEGKKQEIYAMLRSHTGMLLQVLTEETCYPAELWEGVMQAGLHHFSKDAYDWGLIDAIISC